MRFLLFSSLLLAACGQKTDSKESNETSDSATDQSQTTETAASEQEKPNKPISYRYILSSATGDLNKDHLRDSVVVSMDTLNRYHPYRLLVYFGEPGNRYKLNVIADKVIEPDWPDGKKPVFLDGGGFASVTIERGVLWINGEWLRGHYEHKFRYQNGNFELIGYTGGDMSGGLMYFTDFNLVTGVRIDKEEYMGDAAAYEPEIYKKSETTKKVLIRPLPKLQEFVPFSDERIDL